MKYAVFCLLKNNDRSVGDPCLDPLDYGRDGEPERDLLLRRGRVKLFDTRELAESAIAATVRECWGMEFVKRFKFVVLECE